VFSVHIAFSVHSASPGATGCTENASGLPGLTTVREISAS
jgi:hypothetical protein